jgi:hypothetical protein
VPWGHFERAAKGKVRKPGRQVGIERILTDCRYEIQSVDVTHGRFCAPSDNEFILVSRNTIPLERPPPSPARLRIMILSPFLARCR